jgi:putative ABC transport system permease protein
MKSTHLILRSLTHYWRTNVAVVLGVATAVAVLSGALLVGDSVRGSLRDLVLQRLGNTDFAIVSAGFFREALAEDLQSRFEGVAPIIVSQGFVQGAGQIRVYGVDERFLKFHGDAATSIDGSFITPALARELSTQAGDSILIRIQRPSAVPLESLHGRKDDLGSSIRTTTTAAPPGSILSSFSLEAQQSDVRAVFLPMKVLQREMEVGERVNTLLVSASEETSREAIEQAIREQARLEDLGLRLKMLEDRGGIIVIALESDAGFIDDVKANAARQAETVASAPVLTYLANSLRIGGREIPYSLVTAIDMPGVTVSGSGTPIVLNDWAAKDLQAKTGDTLTMEYYVWEDSGRLATRSAEFQVAGIGALDPRDRDFAPVYPGITDSPTLEDWDPPFDIDLRRIRPVDEQYWKSYRTTPKAFIHLGDGQRLWQTRYGKLTSIRFHAAPPDLADRIRREMDPLKMGFSVAPVRADSLEASGGATDFGEYFVYFSFFLVVSALLLAALFFRLSVEHRAREIGLLRAVGISPAVVSRLFIGEGFLLSVVGAGIGIVAGIGYAYLLITALRTWWVDAVGTTAITLHMSPFAIAGGALGGIAAALVCIWATLRALGSVPERRLLADQISADEFDKSRRGRTTFVAGIILAILGAALMAAGAAGAIDQSAGFFGAGSALLAACCCLFVFKFGRPARGTIDGNNWWTVSRLGLRNATYRPARSVTALAMIAAATFILISVDAFRKDDASATTDKNSGVGGYSLLAESLVPLVHDPNSSEGREMLGLTNFDSSTVSVEPFRLRPGDDASCLNLYEPKNPRILAPRDSFIDQGRFAFRSSLASSDAERANPWLLLRRQEPDGAVPVIADANSMTYVLHKSLGEDFVITIGDREVRLRLVGALADSIFQSELLMSDANFRALFPQQEGYPYMLLETPADRQAEVASALEERLSDFGADATSTAERLAEFHRVENTYLTTFQMLGGLGLLLGTVGLGAVLLRNVMERRKELALLRAVGYKQTHFFAMTIAENGLLLVGGLVTGALCALLSIAPALWERGGGLPTVSLVILLAGVLMAGLITSLLATATALRSPLLSSLRSE